MSNLTQGNKILYLLKRYSRAFRYIFMANSIVLLMSCIFTIVAILLSSIQTFFFCMGITIYGVCLHIIMYAITQEMTGGKRNADV